MKVKIYGYMENSLVDVLFNVSFVIWFSGCNFKCPWCYNSYIADGAGEFYEIDEILDKIREQRGFIDYVQATGGEPTLQPEALEYLFKKVKEIGIKTSLNSNSSNPNVVKKLVKKRLMDHYATDVKTELSEEKYYNVIGVKFPDIIKRVRETLEIVREVPFLEIRTTAIPNIVWENEIINIAKSLKEIYEDKEFYYVIQQYLPESTVRDRNFLKIRSPSKEELALIAKKVKEISKIPNVIIRTRQGVFKI